MQLDDRRIGFVFIGLGGIANLGFFVTYVGKPWGLFFFVVAAWILAPWFILAATLRLRPLGPKAAALVTIVSGILLLATSAVFIGAWGSLRDAQGGVIFVGVPFFGIAITTVVFFLVWSAVRSKRNRLAHAELNRATQSRAP